MGKIKTLIEWARQFGKQKWFHIIQRARQLPKQKWPPYFIFVLGICLIGFLAWCDGTRSIWLTPDQKKWDGIGTRNVLFALGAWGGVFALFLAARRSDIAQKQAETAEANLFNDRLSRAIVGLSNNESLAARNAALRLLKNLAEDLPEGDRNRDWSATSSTASSATAPSCCH